MNTDKPALTRCYQNHHLDSTRWQLYRPRPGDVIVTTAYKAGTTWTQLIVLQLLHLDDESVLPLQDASPWPDRRLRPSRDALANELGASRTADRLCLKTHLPLDGLPYFEQVRYVIVGRDPRDVFMSLFNHYHNYTDEAYAQLNGNERIGAPLPRCPDEPRALWREWITRGWFGWESEGYPFWSNMRHTQTYWDYRHLPNFLFVHFADLLGEPLGEIRRVAEFLGMALSDTQLAAVVRATRFDAVKKAADVHMPHLETFFKGGADSFFFSGSNGRWRDVLTDADLELYASAKQRVLSDDCAQWLEHGARGIT